MNRASFPAHDPASTLNPSEMDIVCLSHLRWDFVYQRPQHLLSRAASKQRVFFFEEPIYHDKEACLETRTEKHNLIVATPRLPHGTSDIEAAFMQEEFLLDLLETYKVENYCAWYYTPMALKFSQGLKPRLIVYDCMDQLSQFKNAPMDLPGLERLLLQKADLVFTGGQSLYEAKRDLHPSVHAFPSSVDIAHFGSARAQGRNPPPDMAPIKGPKIGYMGVIDERIDLELIEAVARKRPEWAIIMLGPVVKIDPETLPRLPNIHYLGSRPYDQLPAYLADWDIGMLPFAHNEATQYISPTKTPEYLAAGIQVISTSIRDVVRPYAHLKLVAIADDVETFLQTAESMLEEGPKAEWQERVRRFLSHMSWDKTYDAMCELMLAEVHAQTDSMVEGSVRGRLGMGLAANSNNAFAAL